jgi:hypothetical protein
MRVTVRPMRQSGRMLRAAEAKEAPGRVGDLVVADRREPALARTFLCARLLHLKGTGEEILPELRDVRMLCLQEDEFRLSGFEKVDDAEYAQTWLVEVSRCSK